MPQTPSKQHSSPRCNPKPAIFYHSPISLKAPVGKKFLMIGTDEARRNKPLVAALWSMHVEQVQGVSGLPIIEVVVSANALNLSLPTNVVQNATTTKILSATAVVNRP